MMKTRSRLFDSDCASVSLKVNVIDNMDDSELLFSYHYACSVCGFTVPELEPRLFLQRTIYSVGSDGLGNQARG